MKYQQFSGVDKGLLLSDRQCEYIATMLLGDNKDGREVAANFLLNSARTWYACTTEEEYKRIKTGMDVALDQCKLYGCD